jgi:hypothetical protein
MRFLALLFLTSCSGSLPSQSFIDKLRVLAVRADPPEVAPGVASSLSVLAVEPPVQQLDGGPPSPVSYLWLACSIPTAASASTPCGLGTDNPLPNGGAIPPLCNANPGASGTQPTLCLLGNGPTASYTPVARQLGSDGTGQVLVTVVVSDEPDGAEGCLTSTFANNSLPTNPNHCVLALKQLRVSDPTRKLQDGSAAPPPNANPSLDTFTLDGASLLDGSAHFTPATTTPTPKITLAASMSSDASEQYPTFDDNGVRSDVFEQMTLSWFTTAGAIASSRAGFVPANCATQSDCPTVPPGLDATVDWTIVTSTDLPQFSTDGTVFFWGVLRDDRGGVGWLAGSATPR